MFFRRLILIAVPARAWFARYLAVLLMLIAFMTMLISKQYTDQLSDARALSLGVFAPVISVFAEPAKAANQLLTDLRDIAALRTQNEQLRTENEKLQDWYNHALRLQAENQSLRDLLNMKQDAELNYVAARVIGDSSSTYAHSLLIEIPRSAANNLLVKRGMAAMSGKGLIGRVVDIDPLGHYARVLLITDMSSRIPVLLENSRQRAVVAGDNSELLSLDHLPEQTPLQAGERVVTSGYDGVFPVGLPIGRIVSTAGDTPTVQPLSDLDRLDMIRLVDYGTIENTIMPSKHIPFNAASDGAADNTKNNNAHRSKAAIKTTVKVKP